MNKRSDMRIGRRAAAVSALATALVLVGSLTGPAALAEPTAPPPPTSGDTGSAQGSAALITPLLMLLEFGDAVGLPLACNLATSLVTTGAGQVNASSLVSPVVTQINNLCNTLSAKGDEFLLQAIDQSKALTFINPALNPIIEAMNTGAQNMGGVPAVAPFGPTIAGLGGTVAFFEGA